MTNLRINPKIHGNNLSKIPNTLLGNKDEIFYDLQQNLDLRFSGDIFTSKSTFLTPFHFHDRGLIRRKNKFYIPAPSLIFKNNDRLWVIGISINGKIEHYFYAKTNNVNLTNCFVSISKLNEHLFISTNIQYTIIIHREYI